MQVDENAALIAERRSMYEMLQTLTDDEWDHQSLCEGWRVRDVAAHVHLDLTISFPRLVVGLITHRGDFNGFMADYAPRHGSRPIDEILSKFSELATSAKVPPTTKKVEIALDCFVHHQDICVPLGRGVESDPLRMRWMADGMVAAKKPIGSGPRVAGLHLIATDIDWHYGTGPEVRGAVAALLLTGCGRNARAAELSGDGVATLVSRP